MGKRSGKFIGYAGRAIALLALLGSVAGCGDEEGACVSRLPGLTPSCYNGYTRSDCIKDEGDSSWQFYPDKTCSSLGFTTPCGDDYPNCFE